MKTTKSIKSNLIKKKKNKQFKKKETKLPSIATLKLNCEMNNTRLDLTDASGNVLIWKTSSSVGYKNCKKSTSLAASVATQKMVKEAYNRGVRQCNLEIKGIGSGKSIAMKKIFDSQLEIIDVKYVIKLAHNGCRLKKARRT